MCKNTSSTLQRYHVLKYVNLICSHVDLRHMAKKDDVSQLQSFSQILILCSSCANPSTNLKCHPGLSCSKKLRGQTWQVNRSHSDRVYPQTRPLLSKNTRGPSESAVLPYTEGLWWFTASVHSPYKHIIHMSSSRPLGGLFRELRFAFWRFFHFSTVDETLSSAPDRSLHLWHQNMAQI